MKNIKSSYDYTEKLKRKIKKWGADLSGIADLEPLKELEVNPPDLLDGFTRAVSIAVMLPVAVFEQIKDRPTPLYASVYQTANRMLDEMAFKISVLLQIDGYLSLPVPASQVLDRKNWTGAISHKAVARMAGIGWQGKNLLLITAKYGSRVRLVTVLTNAPLKVDGPVKNRCGECTMCRDACPVGAIKGVGTETYYHEREEALYLERCAGKLTGEFAAIPDIGVPVCGICIKVCPFGRRS
ncbi:MAG: 4Fe-4S double cluster binding domain-containing protein [Desulfobacterales bacterium]